MFNRILLATLSLLGPIVVHAQSLEEAPVNIADRIFVGRMPCEAGVSVDVMPDAQTPGKFILTLGRKQYRMDPVMTTTGAVRLENSEAGLVWLQLPHKSMLMNQVQGRRLADECKSDMQARFAQALLKAPAVGLFDVVPVSVAMQPVSEPIAIPAPVGDAPTPDMHFPKGLRFATFAID